MKCSALKWGPDGRTLMRKRRTGFNHQSGREAIFQLIRLYHGTRRLFPGTPKSCFIINYKYHHVSPNYRFYTWNSCFLSPNAGGSMPRGAGLGCACRGATKWGVLVGRQSCRKYRISIIIWWYYMNLNPYIYIYHISILYIYISILYTYIYYICK